MPDRVLKPGDFHKKNPGQQWRPQLGMARDSGYRDHSQKNPNAALRMLG